MQLFVQVASQFKLELGLQLIEEVRLMQPTIAVIASTSSTFVAGKPTIVMGLHIITADSITAAAFVGESCFVHVLASTTVVHLPMLESRSGCTGVGLAVETCSFN